MYLGHNMRPYMTYLPHSDVLPQPLHGLCYTGSDLHLSIQSSSDSSEISAVQNELFPFYKGPTR